jgi:murein DD-endopeptidase MepM/ murein hydrolase activator NlpD
VVFSGVYGGYGNVIVLEHPQQFFTVYGHNSSLIAPLGQWVRQGEVISLVGATGRATGPHLHFEARQGNQYLDPLQFLSGVASNLPTHGPWLSHTTAPAQSASESMARGGPELIEGTHKKPVVHHRRLHSHPNSRTVEVFLGDRLKTLEF